MASKPGRKPCISDEELKLVILERKDDIFLSKNKLKSKTDIVWQNLSQDVGGKLSAATFYSKLCDPHLKKKYLVEM